MSEPLLDIDGLSVVFPSRHGPIRAVDDLSLSVKPGEVLGIAGESGSGKSQLLLAIMGLLAETAWVEGNIRLDGADLGSMTPNQRRRWRAERLAMVFQDASSALNPYLTIGRQLTEQPMQARNLSRAQADRLAVQALERVRVTEAKRRLGQYPHELSGGMRQRVMLAMALLAKPKLLLADEPTTALDVTVQAEILEILRELARDNGTALILVTHDLGVIAHLCERVAIMYAGRIVESGSASQLFSLPAHPYSRALLAAMPRLTDDPADPLRAITGQPPDLAALEHEACAFAPRCPSRMARCTVRRPEMRRLGVDHHAACFLHEEVAQ